MSIKAELRVVLYANEVLVDESTDRALWQRIFSVINGGGNESLEQTTFSREPHSSIEEKEKTPKSPNDHFIKFANDLGIGLDIVKGACAPSLELPFLHLDLHAWETFRDNHPTRGAGAITAPALAGTLLSLWFINADLDTPSISMVNGVLKTINIEDKNIPRGIRNC